MRLHFFKRKIKKCHFFIVSNKLLFTFVKTTITKCPNTHGTYRQPRQKNPANRDAQRPHTVERHSPELRSRAAIHQRIQRLIELKVITGSGYNVNPKVLGLSTCTYIGVNLERGSMYRDVVPEFDKIPEIVECHFTTGPYTMLIKLYARDNEHLMELLNKKIQMIPGVTGTETLISLDQSIAREIPINLEPEEN